MLLRGKYDVLINVTWDCFDQSNFYISRINIIEWNKKICSPEIARGKYDYFEGEKNFTSPLCKGNECFIPSGRRFGEFCQMKSVGHLCLQNYYFGTSLELSLLTSKVLNLENFE